jgi:CheY-like chemotaxis protein
MADLLRNPSMDVVTVTTVRAALDALRDPFDYIILDLMLPDGNGADVLHHLRQPRRAAPGQSAPEPRVCVVTAANEPSLLARVNALKPHCLLRKPIDLSELRGGLGLAS